jgi:hypothetical protein
VVLGPEHAILRGLRERGSETELTRVLAATLGADPAFAAAFVRTVLERSKRSRDSRWEQLPQKFECRGEVVLPEGTVDLQFSDAGSGWRVLVELKIDAGYGSDQIERYLRDLDPSDERQILVSITRDVPKYGDPPLDGRRNWAGSLSWGALFDDLRALRPSNEKLAMQWPLLLDVLEAEGSMGVTRVKPELLRAWAQAVPARNHVVAFMQGMRPSLLAGLQEALGPVFPDLAPAARASAADTPTAGRRPQVDVNFFVPRGDEERGGEERVAAQLWAWEDFRFTVSVRYPADDRSQGARVALASLDAAGFVNWKNSWLWRSLPLDDELLASPALTDRLLEWAKESFDLIAASGVLGFDVLPLAPAAEDEQLE